MHATTMRFRPAMSMALGALAAALLMLPAVPAQAAQKAGQRHDLTLTKRDFGPWKMRSVFDANGQKVGTVSAITLDRDGEIASIRFTPSLRGIGRQSIRVPAEQMSIGMQRIAVDYGTSQLKAMEARIG